MTPAQKQFFRNCIATKEIFHSLKPYVVLGVFLFGLAPLLASDFSVTSPSSFYEINGISPNPTLTLVRGQTYTFSVNTAPFHPFQILSPGAATGNNTSSGTITYTVATNAPATNNPGYQCSIHHFFGIILTIDPPPASNTLSGIIELQSFAGTNRMVRFVTSQVNGGSTNYLLTNDVICGFTGAATNSYNLTVPTNTTHISAKTAWNLRRRQAVTFSNATATVNFTGSNNLPGGDVAIGSPSIDNTDNAVTSSDYLLLLGYYLQAVNGDTNIARADLNGDGAVASTDYLLLLGNYLSSGDLP